MITVYPARGSAATCTTPVASAFTRYNQSVVEVSAVVPRRFRSSARTENFMKYIALFVLCLSVAACSVPRSRAEGGPIANHQVVPRAKVLILSIADGQEQGQKPAPGSGKGMVAALRAVLAAHGVPLSTTETASVQAGVDEARRNGFDYVLQCAITLWEDNATAWSGNGDKLNISCELYDASSRELIAASTHKRVATGTTLVSGSPDRFMDEVAAGALGKIYGWPPGKT
jgi:uncharacterized protein DUF4823